MLILYSKLFRLLVHKVCGISAFEIRLTKNQPIL